jgi:hypothetical protein
MHAGPPVDCSAGTQSRLTAPIDGLYLVEASLEWAANSTGRRQLEVVKNNAVFEEGDTRPAIGLGDTEQSIASEMNLNAGDYVAVQATQDSGSALSLPDSELNHFAMTWIGPPPE